MLSRCSNLEAMTVRLSIVFHCSLVQWVLYEPSKTINVPLHGKFSSMSAGLELVLRNRHISVADHKHILFSVLGFSMASFSYVNICHENDGAQVAWFIYQA